MDPENIYPTQDTGGNWNVGTQHEKPSPSFELRTKVLHSLRGNGEAGAVHIDYQISVGGVLRNSIGVTSTSSLQSILDLKDEITGR